MFLETLAMSSNTCQGIFMLKDCGKWYICCCKSGLRGAACCSPALTESATWTICHLPWLCWCSLIISLQLPSLPLSDSIHYPFSLTLLASPSCILSFCCNGTILVSVAGLVFSLLSSLLCHTPAFLLFFSPSAADSLCHCHSLVHVSLVTVCWAFYYPLLPFALLSPAWCCLILYFLLPDICFSPNHEVWFICGGFYL